MSYLPDLVEEASDLEPGTSVSVVFARSSTNPESSDVDATRGMHDVGHGTAKMDLSEVLREKTGSEDGDDEPKEEEEEGDDVGEQEGEEPSETDDGDEEFPTPTTTVERSTGPTAGGKKCYGSRPHGGLERRQLRM